jgi:hypothetical protein
MTTGNYIADGVFDWAYMNNRGQSITYRCEMCSEDVEDAYSAFSNYLGRKTLCCEYCAKHLNEE